MSFYITKSTYIIPTTVTTIIAGNYLSPTVQKMKFFSKDFLSKCDQILNGKRQFFCSAQTQLNLTAISIFAVHLLCNIVFLSGFKVQNVVSHQTLWKNYRYGFTFIKICQAF